MTKEIKLTKGFVAIIDDEDYERVSKINWQASKKSYDKHYARGSTYKGNRKNNYFLLHRFILNAPKGKDVDHINGDTMDNRKENLRICTHQENCRNADRKKRKCSYKGVRKVSGTNKYSAYIKIEEKQKYLGMFHTQEDAAAAYNMAALRYFKEFAKLNLIGVYRHA